MTKCASCGTEADNASYCPECGGKIIREPIAPDPANSVDESNRWGTPNSTAVPGQSSVYASDSGSAYRSEYSGESPAQIYPNSQYTSGTYQKKPDGSGQMIFAVINIVISVLMCCYIIPLILGIIAVVYASGANKAMTAEEAESKIKTARILNIIAVVSIIIGVLLGILYFVFVVNNPAFIAEMSRQGYR